MEQKGKAWKWIITRFLLAVVCSIFVISLVIPTSSFAQNDYTIKLKSRQFIPSEDRSSFIESKLLAAPSERVHVIMQFQELPNASMKAVLEDAGVKLLSYIPSNAWFASIPRAVKAGMPELSSVRWIGEILPQDKIDRRIFENRIGPWAKNPDGTTNLRVNFFDDVSLDKAKQAISGHGASILKELPHSNSLTISVDPDMILTLAEEDIVQWITEIPPPKTKFNDGSRTNVQVNFLHEAPYNLSGNNVVAGIWDGGDVDDTHDDFGSRVTVVDNVGEDDHATHVSGTMGGDGALSEGSGGAPQQWKGMAPAITIISYDWDDNIIEHDDAIDTYHIDISQNSWGYTISSGLNNCDLYGDYVWDAPDYDNIARGRYGKNITVVFAAGNERDDGDCGIDARGGYSCIGPPATAKNIITVGAINSNDDTMTTFSSWGPLDDGRIKPDVVAPGCQAGGDGGITSTIPDDTYDVMCGTSMAAPVVSGISALMIEEFRNQTSSEPLPSTIKAILINTAEDLGSPGPDYSYGFGKVNAKTAADAVIAGSYDEGAFDGPNGVETYTLSVHPDTPKLQITLVWDDFPGTLNADPALVNHLDLILYDPNGNVYRPWELTPSTPEANAIECHLSEPDEINNVEQITVNSPVSGTWTVHVVGADIPEYPQTYSLAWPYEETGHMGEISSDTVWAAEDSPHIILDTVTVGPDARLTVESGAEVRFLSDKSLVIDGALSASNVTFTSDETFPVAGDWWGIKFTSASNNKTSSLTDCTIEYSQYGIYFESTSSVLYPVTVSMCTISMNSNTGIYIINSSPQISGCTIKNHSIYGIYVSGSSSFPTISDSTITQEGGYIGQGSGIYCYEGATVTITGSEIDLHNYGIYGYSDNPAPTLTITGNTVTNNTDSGIYLRAYSTSYYGPAAVINNNNIYANSNYDIRTWSYKDASTTIINAENNWWGTIDPVVIASNICDYSDSNSLPAVDFSAFLDGPGGSPITGGYKIGCVTSDTTWSVSESPILVVGKVMVDASATLTIESGVELRFIGSNNFIEVDGRMVADNVTFTSNETFPDAGDWGGIKFTSASNNKTSSLTDCTIEYSQYGIYLDSTSSLPYPVTVSGCTISMNSNTGIYILNSSPSISSSTIKNHANYGIYVSGSSSFPTIYGNTITQEGGYIGQGSGIYCYEGATVTITGNEIDLHNYGIYGYSYYVGPPMLTITDNTVVNNTDSGIYLSAINTSFYGPAAVINNNNIYANSNYDVRTGSYKDASTTIIDAENNWWGTVEPVVIASRVYDYSDDSNCPTVDYDPWLDAPVTHTPSPNIKANGKDDSLFVIPGENINITVSLDPADMSGESCDWWVGAFTPVGTYWLNPSLRWIKSNSPISVRQLPLFDLSETSLLDMPLPEGIHMFFFVIDDTPDRTFRVTWYDYVNVINQPEASRAQAEEIPDLDTVFREKIKQLMGQQKNAH